MFPIILKPSVSSPSDYNGPQKEKYEKIDRFRNSLEVAHPNLLMTAHKELAAVEVERPAVVLEEYEDGSAEQIWDTQGFRVEPVAITIERRAQS